jgi:hypothetical protein
MHVISINSFRLSISTVNSQSKKCVCNATTVVLLENKISYIQSFFNLFTLDGSICVQHTNKWRTKAGNVVPPQFLFDHCVTFCSWRTELRMMHRDEAETRETRRFSQRHETETLQYTVLRPSRHRDRNYIPDPEQ